MPENHNHHPESRHHFENPTSEAEEGVLSVTSSGSIKITTDFCPDEVDATFIDPDPEPHCGGDNGPDEVKIKLLRNEHSFDISWKITSRRVIKWTAKKLRR